MKVIYSQRLIYGYLQRQDVALIKQVTMSHIEANSQPLRMKEKHTEIEVCRFYRNKSV